MGWQWHQFEHMQIICISFQIDNHATISPLSFHRPNALPDAQPTNSVKALKALANSKLIGIRFRSAELMNSQVTFQSFLLHALIYLL